MPTIRDRINAGHDCISGFETAASRRFKEATSLLRHNQRYASIYLLGYSIEMWIKAAYFRNEGILGPNAPIAMAHLRRAWVPAPGIPTTINLHDFAAWARLLTRIRAISMGMPPYAPQFQADIIAAADSARRHWDPVMGYRSVRLSPWEAEIVHNAANWFKKNYTLL